MPNNVNEYVFCPYCGSITTPGICTQCGYNLNQNQENTEQDTVADSEQSFNYFSQNNIQYNNQFEQQPVQQNVNQYNNLNHNQYGSQFEQQNTNQFQYNNQYMNQPQYGMYQNMPAEPERKKSRWWIWLLIIGGILFVLVFLAVLVLLAVTIFAPMIAANGNTTVTQASTQTAPIVQEVETSEDSENSEISEEESTSEDWNQSSGAGGYAYAVYEADHTRYDFSDFDWSAYANSADTYSDTTDGADDFYLADTFSSTFGTNHDNHYGEAFLGDYFDPFVETIDYNQEYGLERHFMSYDDEKDGVSIYASIAYMQFTGGTIPNEEALNQEILNATANDLFAYLDGKKTYDVVSSLHFFVDSFVVYNDAEKMSILLDISVVGDESTYADAYVYAINIATKSGEILDNGQFISVDEAFAAEFRERCCTQNGTDIEGLNNVTDEELAELLSDKKTNIVFFSPYGLEFGYNYEMASPEGYSRGWMTITMKDWADYTEMTGSIVSVPAGGSGTAGISTGGTTEL